MLRKTRQRNGLRSLWTNSYTNANTCESGRGDGNIYEEQERLRDAKKEFLVVTET